jgi:hypothetical protein
MAANQPDAAQRWETLLDVHRQLSRVVDELDRIELNHAAAHVSSALDILRRDFPELAVTH